MFLAFSRSFSHLILTCLTCFAQVLSELGRGAYGVVSKVRSQAICDIYTRPRLIDPSLLVITGALPARRAALRPEGGECRVAQLKRADRGCLRGENLEDNLEEMLPRNSPVARM